MLRASDMPQNHRRYHKYKGVSGKTMCPTTNESSFLLCGGAGGGQYPLANRISGMERQGESVVTAHYVHFQLCPQQVAHALAVPRHQRRRVVHVDVGTGLRLAPHIDHLARREQRGPAIRYKIIVHILCAQL